MFNTVLSKGTIFFLSKCSGTVGVSDGKCPKLTMSRIGARGILENSGRKFYSDMGAGTTLIEGQVQSAELGIRRDDVNMHSGAIMRLLCIRSLIRRRLLATIGRHLRSFTISKVLSDKVLRRLARRT